MEKNSEETPKKYVDYQGSSVTRLEGYNLGNRITNNNEKAREYAQKLLSQTMQPRKHSK